AGREHAYLADFGVSRHAATASSEGSTDSSGMSYDYAAPERFDEGPVDRRADGYSLACVAFECLTGTPPFKREPPEATMMAPVSAAPPSAAGGRAWLPAAVDPVLHRELAKKPAERYPTCSEFAADLTAAVAGRLRADALRRRRRPGLY